MTSTRSVEPTHLNGMQPLIMLLITPVMCFSCIDIKLWLMVSECPHICAVKLVSKTVAIAMMDKVTKTRPRFKQLTMC